MQGLAVDKLARKLRRLSKLQNLSFKGVGLTDSGLIRLSEIIKSLSDLTYLGLANNEINGEELPVLVYR